VVYDNLILEQLISQVTPDETSSPGNEIFHSPCS
jgi:hypothetical protein